MYETPSVFLDAVLRFWNEYCRLWLYAYPWKTYFSTFSVQRHAYETEAFSILLRQTIVCYASR